jgi:ADP-dependent NAD(P)H-hydrate dehydratase / NAD(P)H-hydrate epimerase
VRSADAVLKLDHLTCLAAGPGLGQTPDAAFYLGLALQAALPLVADADALNLIAMDGHLAGLLKGRRAPSLLTPHPAEAARLLGCTVRQVQDDRIESAVQLAAKYNSLVVLKGAGSICAGPDGAWHINTSGNPGMASAGMGDVLTGMMASLLAQGAEARDALLSAVHLHGAAADRAVAAGAGPIGLSATEIIDAARAVLNEAAEHG